MRPRYSDILDKLWRDHAAPRAADAPTVISLFSGGGLSLLGYLAGGFRALLAVDIDARALEVVCQNFPGCPTWCGDIRGLTVEEVLRITGLRVGELDLLDGSPPCECFSTLGDRNPDDPRNLLPFEFARLLDGLQPKSFVMEEVPAFASGRTRDIYNRLLQQLEGSGYRVKPQVLLSHKFGVPQNRKRLIIIGVRKDLGVFPSHPVPEREL